MNRIALGTVQFGMHYGIANNEGQVSRQEAKAMLNLASMNGVDTLDTAIAYGDSENCLGEIGTKGFKVVTKLPGIPDDCADIERWVKQQITDSQSRLNCNSVYGVLLHQPDQLLSAIGPDLYRALQSLKINREVQKIGISIYAPSQLDSLVPRYDFDLVQAPFSLIDNRLYRSGWLQRLKDFGVEVHTRSAFLQGLLFLGMENLPSKFLRWNDLWLTWHQWLRDANASPLSACLAYPLSFPEIDRVVIGADSVTQLAQILSTKSKLSLSDFPDIQCSDENLINPAKWLTL